MTLLGRSSERATLDGLVADVLAGRSRVLVVRGEPGIGKTALLQYLAYAAAGCRIVRVAGVKSEMELPFAGLHQLCSPFLAAVEELPGPQRDALSTALGRRTGGPPDRFLVGLAALTLLSGAAESQPLICLVDDAQWLDDASGQAIAFVARRLLADPVAIVVSVRDFALADVLKGLPEIVLLGLADQDADALLTSAVTGPLDARVHDQVLREAHGNPLALLELPRGLAAAQLSFGSRSREPMSVASRVEQGFVRRVERLPAPTRLLLLTAAAEPTGDPLLLWRAAERLEVPLEASVSAEEAGLIEMRDRVVFRHPLVRSAVYRSAPLHKRQAVHRALADVTDPNRDPDRRAWHRAHGAVGPDEDVAVELERSAGRALARGGVAAAAALMRESVLLTPQPERRAGRALEAAQATFAAGAFADALTLLTVAEARPLEALERARIDLLRAQVMFASQRGNRALPLLLAAARRLEPLDLKLALDTYLDAFAAAMFAGRYADGPGIRDVASAAQHALQHPELPRKGDLLLKAVATMFTGGHSAAAEIAREASLAFRYQEVSLDEGLRFMWLGIALTVEMWDYDNWVSLTARHLQIARESGALSALPLALNSHIYAGLFSNGVDHVAPLVDEARTVTEVTGDTLAPYGEVTTVAWQGREDRAMPLINRSLHDVTTRREGIGVSLAHWNRAVLCNALGRYADAADAARAASTDSAELGAFNWALFELVEAAERAGDHDVAIDATQRLAESTMASGSDWGLGIQSYAAALVDGGDTADNLYRRAISRLGATGARAYLARAHLVYGEWLRRNGRRKEAREQLRAAQQAFTEMGFEAFSERARRELAATGETVHRRTVETREELTGQEAYIARLAAGGLTNPEIGTELFLSPRTVEWHLRKVFTKLGITTRRELASAL